MVYGLMGCMILLLLLLMLIFTELPLHTLLDHAGLNNLDNDSKN